MRTVNVSTFAALIAVAAACTKPAMIVEHQRGNHAILEGHEVHRYPIYLDGTLAPGRHDLGSLSMDGLGTVPVAVVVSKSGEIEDIVLKWPSGVVPEEMSMVSHPVYRASPGSGITQAGRGKCKLIHAGGSCMGCSRYIWVELIIRV